MEKTGLISLTAILSILPFAYAQSADPLRLVQTIPLPNVEGRIDHFAVDAEGQRLFVAALGNNTLEVLDLRAGRPIHSIQGLAEPQGIAYVPGLDRVFVANGADGFCRIFDGHSFRLIGSVTFSEDADNVRYDRAKERIYVGYGDGALGIIEPKEGKRLGEIKLERHPESFQLEKSGPLIFVNVPRAGHIAVVDRNRGAVVSRWPLSGAGANFPMALDEAHHRLFVACRKPPEVLVLDTETGKMITQLSAVGDADDMFYDAAHRFLYVSGGEGFISVLRQRDPDHYEPVARIRTAPGARTSLFVSELHRLYLAVPHRGTQGAEIRVYETRP